MFLVRRLFPASSAYSSASRSEVNELLRKMKGLTKRPSSLPVPSSLKNSGTFTLVCVDSCLHTARGETLESQLEEQSIL